MATRTLWAVIQTGTITPDADIVPFKTGDGKRTPAILFVSPDYDKTARRKKRLASIFARYRGFGAGASDDLQLCMPVLGVVQLTEEEPVKKKKPAPATPPTVNGTPEPPPPSADQSKPGRKRGSTPATPEPVAA